MFSEGSDSEGSDIQIQSALPKMPQKKLQKLQNSLSDELLKKKGDKKLTTKVMIHEALIDLKSRKGVSLHAIKKYIADKYNVDTEKLNYHIKKFIKSAIEQGTIIQTKGIGATGSFKLAPVKGKKLKTKNPKKEKKEKTKDPEKKKKSKDKLKKTEGKNMKSKVQSKGSKEDKPVKSKKKMDAEKKPNEKKDGDEKTKKDGGKKTKKDGGEKMKKIRVAKDMQTPLKKKTMMRRKSIGTIIKPPKMKPRAKT